MILEKGDMWSVFDSTDAFVITTNPIITRDGRVVMGRGIAKQMLDRFPGIDKDFAEELALQSGDIGYTPGVGGIGEYGYNKTPVLWFMVKNHWRSPADTFLIKRSVHMLAAGAMYEQHRRFDLNFPGIGNGKLDRAEVLPLIEMLPDNVHVWEYE